MKTKSQELFESGNLKNLPYCWRKIEKKNKQVAKAQKVTNKNEDRKIKSGSFTKKNHTSRKKKPYGALGMSKYKLTCYATLCNDNFKQANKINLKHRI